MSDQNSQAPAPQEPAASFSRFSTSHEAHDRRHFERHGTHVPPLSASEGDAAPAAPKQRRKRGEAAPKVDAAEAKAEAVASGDAAVEAEPAAVVEAKPGDATVEATADEAEAKPARRPRALKPNLPKGKAKGAKRSH